MAKTEKRSFVLHYDLEAQTAILSDAQLGRLLRAVFAYEIRGEFPELDDDGMLLMCFQFVKTTLDINRQKYEERCEQNAENGKKGGRPPKHEKSGFDSVFESIPLPKAGNNFKPSG